MLEISLPVSLAVLAGALLHATWNALIKASPDHQLDTIALPIAAGILALLLVPWLPTVDPTVYPWLAASALVHVAYFWALAGAYRWGDLSFTYPIMRGGGPAIVTLTSGFILGEPLSITSGLGIACILLGVFAFAMSPASDPATLRKSLAYALGNAGVIAAYTIIDGRGARLSGAPISYALWFFVANGAVILVVGFLQKGRALPSYLQRNWKHIGAGGACVVGSYGVALWAMTLAPIALVATLRETSIVFVAIIGAVFLGERFTRRRLVASAAVVMGLAILRLWPDPAR